MAEELKVALLEQKLGDLKEIIVRLDDNLEKMGEVNSNVTRMLAVHEQRITKQEEIDNVLFSQVDKLRDKIDGDYDKIVARVQKIEKRVWMAIGALACLTFLLRVPTALQILTPQTQSSIIEQRNFKV